MLNNKENKGKHIKFETTKEERTTRIQQISTKILQQRSKKYQINKLIGEKAEGKKQNKN